MTDDLVTEAREMVRHSARPLWQDTSRVLSGMADRIEELEASLDRAIEWLKECASDVETYAEHDTGFVSDVLATVAELEEKRHA